MRVLILGIQGYIGWPLAQHLMARGDTVFGVDNYSREHRVIEVGSDSLIPVDYNYRLKTLDKFLRVKNIGDLLPSEMPANLDAIVHLGQMPSAPWSMKSFYHAEVTQRENVISNLRLLWLIKQVCPEAHLVKLGTMGEYGTPSCNIPEGIIPEIPCDHLPYNTNDPEGIDIFRINSNCPMEGLQFPRQPGSFYHLSKVFDTYNIDFACRNWNFRATDIMQGVVFGTRTEDITTDKQATRFDYDEYFGTVINRFCAQAVAGFPLTVYGKGGQTRGYLPLQDSIECLTIALDNPPEYGEYRVFNQFAETHSVNELAKSVETVGNFLGLNVKIKNITNPRREAEEHSYNVTTENLAKLGYNPEWTLNDELCFIMEHLMNFKNRINLKVILPKTNWS